MPTFVHAHSKKKILGIFYPQKWIFFRGSAHGNHGNPRIRGQFCSLIIDFSNATQNVSMLKDICRVIRSRIHWGTECVSRHCYSLDSAVNLLDGRRKYSNPRSCFHHWSRPQSYPLSATTPYNHCCYVTNLLNGKNNEKRGKKWRHIF
jgi:hypothetical protein